MNILVLGGTQFSGRSFVEQGVEAGHDLTILHRSQTDPLPASVRRLRGDRDPRKGDGLGEIKGLLDKGERFDAVVDMCGYTPRVTRAACELLADHTDQYLFVSTISVYPHSPDASPSEDWGIERLKQLDDPTVEEVTGETYGGLKVLCERAVEEVMGDRATIIRPCVIAGAHDPTDRVTWWTRALTELDAVILPEAPGGMVQFIDARDLAAFFHRCLSGKITGTFNAAGPEVGLTLHEFVRRSNEALGGHAKVLTARGIWFDRNDIKAWEDIPSWTPADSQSSCRVDYSKALGVGLTPRPLEETMRDIRAWDVARGQVPLKAGMSLDRLRVVMTKASS